MNAEQLTQFKEELRPHLSEIGFKRWEKYLAKCLSMMPVKEAKNAAIKYADEIYNKELQLKLTNGGMK